MISAPPSFDRARTLGSCVGMQRRRLPLIRSQPKIALEATINYGADLAGPVVAATTVAAGVTTAAVAEVDARAPESTAIGRRRCGCNS
jgi:hypothetical protein